MLEPGLNRKKAGEVAEEVKPLHESEPWSLEKSTSLYGIETWGSGYFRINSKGHVCVTPLGYNGTEGYQVDLYELTQDLLDRGLRAPLLIRFPNIIKAQIESISNCFNKAMTEYGYKGQYCGVYPIKVNQQRHLVEEIVGFGRSHRLGLECGSKPELLVALAMMDTPNALIICNGFKDSEYIETAILSQKLGRNTIIVVDRPSELPMIIETAKKFNTKPRIGFRAKLYAKGSGKWVESSGVRSKFGLTPTEIVDGVEILKKEGMLDALELLHFHCGSQITNIQSINGSIKEGARFFTELHAMGANLKYIDVGGGLGVDYDGSGCSDSSINYSGQEYANDVVSVIQNACDERGVPHPNIVTESGRYLVAHHSVLIFNILGINEVQKRGPAHTVAKGDHQIIKDLRYIYDNVNIENINESYNDLMQINNDILQLFTYGVMSLQQRAKAETLYWSTATKMLEVVNGSEDLVEIRHILEQQLSPTYFCNFSLFQSIPDHWAVGQLFPIMPIQRLEEKPDVNITIVDLTCDSDGKIEKFIDTSSGSSKKSLEIHAIKPNEPYYVAVFLLGAYQEILGDLHNLFGDTDAVHITISKAGYTVDHVVEGDSVSEVLSYVQYQRSELIENIRRASEASILRGTISKQEAKLLLKHYEEGLSGYTYLEDPEESL